MKRTSIPKGWRKLRKGTVIERGDEYWDLRTWHKTFCAGGVVGDPELPYAYIRRIPRKK